MGVSHDWLLTADGHPAERETQHLEWPEPIADRRGARPDADCPLGPRPESVKTARDFTRITLHCWGLATLTEQAELVVSELVTNALRHGLRSYRPGASNGTGWPGAARSVLGAQPITLRLLEEAAGVLCMVTDPCCEAPVPQTASPCAENGRGLHVVESCSMRWGWHPLDGGGKVVWALLPRE